TFYVDGVTGKDGRSWRSYLPSPVALDSEVATMAQKAGVSFVTANDVRSLQDTPFDLPQHVNADNLARQVGTILFVMNKAFGPLPKEKVTKEKTIGVDLLPESSLFSQNFGYAIGRAIYRDVTTGTSFLPNTPIPDETMPKPAPLLTAETEKTKLAEIAGLQSSDPTEAAEKQLRLERLRERQKNQETSFAALRGTVAVAQVLNRNVDFKTYSGVRGAFIERVEFSKGLSLEEAKKEGKQSAEPPVAQFVFVGPRVGDPKGGGTPDAEMECYSVNSAGRVIFSRDMGAEKDRFNPKFKKTNQTLNFADEKTNKYAVDTTSLCFECRGTTLNDTLDQRYYAVLSEMTVLDAQTDAPPTEFGFLPSAGSGAWREPIAIVYAKPNERFKLIMAQGLLGKRLVVLHTQPRSEAELEALAETGNDGKRASNVQQHAVYPEGNGIFVREDAQLPNPLVYVANQTARDLWSLDQQRIGLLKRFGITNERVDTLHRMAGGDGKDEKGNVLSETTPNGGALKEAELALANLKYDEFYLQSRRAFGFESRAYPDVEATSQDVLKGIVFYLALLLPFSFFLERLLFGFPDVRKQIFGTGAAFLIIFIGIRYVHPAFELALTPFIILLAFIILALTVVVTSFLSGKFEAEIKRLKQGVHFADVGRLSALSAAFGLGIANMRRRPTRTALTCVTLVLLTFTVLSFTSVTANITNFAKVWAPENTPRYQGVLVRSPDWSPLQQAAVTSMANEFRQKFETLARRAWYLSPNQGEALYLRVNNAEKPEKFFHAPALLGLTPEEKDLGSPIANTIIKGTWFQKDGRRDVCIVPRAMLLPPKPKEEKADAEPPKIPEDKGPPLGLTPENAVGQKIQVAGQVFEIIGVFDNNVWFPDQDSVKAGARPLYDIDGEEFTPVDYSNDQNKTAQQNNQLAGQKGEEVQVQRYQHMDANAMLLLPYESVIDMGGSTRSLAAGFDDMKAGQEQLTDMMNRAALGIFGTDTDKNSGKLVAKLYSSVESAGYEGFAALVVPILIAALIIANTMLGSVYERTREIGIYSAVGLAPIHVAALFIAEAFVYAVLGSISGYLVAQAVAKILTTYNLFSGITLNYSSSSAVIATLIVMATVLLSTLYPAWAASRMSQPDIERKWRLNPPIGDLWRLQFPFTVSGQQPMGVAQFLSDFFETHTDTSVGKFYTDRVFFTSLPLREAVALLNEGLPLGGAPTDGANGVHEAKGAETNGKATKANGKKNGKKDSPEVAAPSVMLLNLSNIAADPEQEVYRLSMRIWLAPFDMGVSQDADIVLLPSPEAGLYELQLRLWRQSGEIAAWQRVNRGFLSDLRKQLLLWRTIPREAQQEYILRGRAHVRGEQVPLEEPGALVGSGTAG
ncbi:MAG TPA: ABC transporter permease, partial [Abditibacteriaceae bacterium]